MRERPEPLETPIHTATSLSLEWVKSLGGRPALALLLLAIGVAGCGEVEPVEAQPFLAIAGPNDLWSFEVRDSGETVLWAIEAEGVAEVSRLDYGAVPAGCRQTVPMDGSPPRELAPGEELTTVTVTTTRVFTHRGFAVGSAAWEINSNSMELIHPPGGASDSEGSTHGDEDTAR